MSLKDEIYEELKKIKELFDIGSLTEEEFEEQKQGLLLLLKQVREGDADEGVSPSSSSTRKEPEKHIIRDIRGIHFEELLIPAGEFIMGSLEEMSFPFRKTGFWSKLFGSTEKEEVIAGEKGREDNETLHKVILTHPFYMAKTPVTQVQFEKLMGYNPSQFRGKDLPVERVNWHEAAAFCNALSREMGLPECYELTGSGEDVEAEIKLEYEGQKYYKCKGYRLPTEAEWEYAYRAGTGKAFYNGDIISTTGRDSHLNKIGWYVKNSGGKTHPVARKKPNAWGLYDMAGNVWEWVYDRYQDYSSDLYSDPEIDPVNARSGSSRVYRGGSWSISARYCRAANRYYDSPSSHYHDLGFRFARSL